MAENEDELHWLVRPATIRKLWIGFSVVLALVVIAQAVIYIKGYFGVDGWFGFGAIYGFVSCLLMVLVAKVLGLVLKRPQGYYAAADENSESDHGQDSAVDKVQGHSDGA
jgi:UPF0716 family protein affecting phage T7 exclusion